MPLFRFLHSLGEISQDDVARLRRRVGEEGLHPIDALAEEIDPEHIAELMTAQLGLPLIDLSTLPIDPDVLRTVNREIATRYDVFPVRRQDDCLVLAMANPLDNDLLKAVQFATRTRVEPVVASLTEIRAAIRRNYLLREELESFLAQSESKEERLEVAPATSLDDDHSEQDGEQKATVVRLVEMLLIDGLRLGASDIHIEPARDSVVVRYRVNGVLESGMTLPKLLNEQIVSRIKIMAELDITERRRPQDGGIRLVHRNRSIDVRVSVLPSKSGEKVVLRLLDPTEQGHSLDAMGLDPAQTELLRAECRRPEGLILISGPTGSGKSTTAHAMLSDIAQGALNIVTIENPIEHRLPGVTQVEVNERQGVTFAGTLRSILRQDPDVIFVGEIRDEETAKIALQASQTGHLVITTVHTVDATSSITRLLDLGLDPRLISSSLRLAIAQRLVRIGCPSCQTEARVPTEVDRARVERYEGDLRSVTEFEGCPRCRSTGYVGRTGLFEIVPITRAVRTAIEQRLPESEIRARVRSDGIESMPAAAIRAVNEGRTTIDEVVRVIPPEDASKTRILEAGATVSAMSDHSARPMRPRILVVDDDRELAEMIRTTLREIPASVEVTVAHHADEAVRILQTSDVHLALLDIGLPGASGVELCARLRASPRWQHLPLFMLTARADDDAKVEAFRAGADDYVVKPIRPRELIARVERALDRAYGPAPTTTPVPGSPGTSDEARPPVAGPRERAPSYPPPESPDRTPDRASVGDVATRPPGTNGDRSGDLRRDVWRRLLGT